MSAKSPHLQTIGQTYRGFILTDLVSIPELQCVLRELIHVKTGARVMMIENDDPENLFCLSFKTLPDRSDGVAHILEHTVLCGSKKFPVKDPFFAMSRRSLNTFMNALTGADFTCYPAASQVHKDFYNLLEVYLDAVFHPCLDEFSFLQEGCRTEFVDPYDPTGSLEYKGIVYNEMKGALSSASARLSEAINETLFPDITYGRNSGGDPEMIPGLTYEELKSFHETYYHPGRCLFYFYGNMAPEAHLDFISDHTLDRAAHVPPLPPIPLQPRFERPVYRETSYPIAPSEELREKSLIAFGWLTCNILEQQEALALSILEIVLMDTDASPLKRALLQSGLCKQADSFIDTEMNEIPWGIILKGCDPESADTLEQIIKDSLEEICATGVSLSAIENAIHQSEFYRSEITGDHSPFGLSLFMRSGLLKQHGANPSEGLMIHSLFERLRKANVEDPHYFTGLIRKHLSDNPHFTRIVMKPDPLLAEREAEREKRELASIKESLSENDALKLVERAKKLDAFRKRQENEVFDLLPKVTLQDIPSGAGDYPLLQESVDGLTVFRHGVFTNDIVYADLVFDIPQLVEEDLPYLRLFTVILTQMGCNGRDYAENLELIQGNTGGIGAGINLNLQAQDHFNFYPTFHLKGKALHRKVPKLFSLLYETMTVPELKDKRRLKEVVEKHFNGLESRLNQSALKYAINLSASGLNTASKVANDLYGLNYYLKIREIVGNFDRELPLLLDKLEDLQKKIMSMGPPHLVLSCHRTMYEELKNRKFYRLHELGALKKLPDYEPWRGGFTLDPVPSQGRIIASPVAFIGKVFRTVSYTHPDAPALAIAAYLFDNLVLHTKIREEGGAYGGGAVGNSISGNFYFYSYRDPGVVSTFQAFSEAVEEVKEGNFDESDLEEAKLEMIQGLDSPISPGSRAEVAYAWWREGRTYDLRCAFRNKLLMLTKEDVMSAVERIIAPQMQEGAAIVFVSKELLGKANRQLIEEKSKPLPIYEI